MTEIAARAGRPTRSRRRPDDLSLVLHELRNPLVGIDTSARVLARELGAHPGAARASAISSEARHLLGMLEAAADAEAASAGRLRSKLLPVDLAALVRDTVSATQLDGRRVNVNGAERPIVVRADAMRIRQVLANLLVNGAQYSPPRAPIDVVLTQRGGSARVEVRDHGPGIPARERAKLFRKFTRLSTAEGTRGSGLGLYICKAIVEDHDGRIDYHANAFRFSLPIAAERHVARRGVTRR